MYRQYWPWERSHLGYRPAALTVVGLGCLSVYAFAKIALPTLSGVIEPILLLASIAGFFAYGGQLRRSGPVWLLALAIVIPVLTWSYAYWTIPEWADSSPRADHLARHFIFIFVAWWLGGSVRNTLLLWSLGAAGLLISPWAVGDGWNELLAGWQGQRIDLGIRNAQHTALLFGAVLLGLIVFWKRIVYGRPYRTARVAFALALLLLSLLVVVASHTRAVVLAYLIVLPSLGLILLSIRLVSARRNRTAIATSRPRTSIAALMGAFAVGLALVASYYVANHTFQRVGSESDVIAHVARGEFDSVRRSSIGIRIHSWRAATEWIAERPILGWGANGSALVNDHTEWLQPYTRGEFGHLHNSYLELLVRYGFLGLSVYLALAIWLLTNLVRAWRAGIVEDDFFAFYLSFLLYWAIVNIFESFLFYSTGVYLLSLVLGGLVSRLWLFKALDLPDRGQAAPCAPPQRVDKAWSTSDPSSP